MRDVDALLLALQERAQRPFDWRGNDCVRHAAAMVHAQTAKWPLAGVRRWYSAAGAMRVLNALGGMETAISARLTPIAPAAARRGDVAGVTDKTFGIRLMIVEGDMLVGPGAQGHVREPRSAMTHAWSAD